MAERPTVMSWSEKSAEAVVAAGLGRRAERVEGPTAMSLGSAVHQKPGQPGRKAGGQGEAKPEALRDELLEYAKGWRRMEREAKASPENRDLLFLTRFGNAYGRRGTDQSSAVNVEMSEFRKRGVKAELQVLRKFRFHQSRCTFGTELARLALSACADVAIVIATVSDALLHGPNSEATTFKYIRFVQALPIKQALSNSFMAAFSGIGAGARHDG